MRVRVFAGVLCVGWFAFGVACAEEPSRTETQRREILREQAERYGLDLATVDAALRAWRDKAGSEYQVGLALLYDKKYVEASEILGKTLDQRKRAEAESRRAVIDNAVVLGQALYAQGRYAEAADAYREAVARDVENAGYLNSLSRSRFGLM